jgi:hypothetical protein
MDQMEDKIDQLDIHNRLMRAYPDVPESFFLVFLVVLIILQILILSTTAFAMPVWSILLCVFIALCSILPIGLITAVSGQRLGLNVMTEFIIGLLIPGKTIAGLAVLVVTLLNQYGWTAPIWALNPNIEKGVPVDYYSWASLCPSTLLTRKSDIFFFGIY